MAETQRNEPTQNSVPKVDNSVSVGENLDFQRGWWKFERFVWAFFVLILIADVLGVFGRGYFAQAELRAADRTLHVHYERVERASTPSIMTVTFGPGVAQNGEVQLLVSESILRRLGNQRISPEPSRSVLTTGGVLYQFAAKTTPAVVEFALQPSFPGVQHMALQVPGHDAVQARVLVVP